MTNPIDCVVKIVKVQPNSKKRSSRCGLSARQSSTSRGFKFAKPVGKNGERTVKKKVIWNDLRSVDECVMSMPPLRHCLVPHVFSINGIASLSLGWVPDSYRMLAKCCLETPSLQAYTERKLRPEPQPWSASEVFDPMPSRFQSWSPPLT